MEGSLYLVFPITKIETFPAISYERALILQIDKNLSTMESAWNNPFKQLLQNMSNRRSESLSLNTD
jgi:hypothetical protein